jgi:uncharacterized protein (UPF0262 family)
MNSTDRWVSKEFEILAQAVYDYDEFLRLEMIPFELHHTLIDKSKVFRIVDIRDNSVVLTCSSLTNPRDILARLYMADNAKNDPQAILDAQNDAIRALEVTRQQEEREAMKDFVAWVARNTKSRWKHNGQMKDDQFRNLGAAKTHIT